MIRTITIFSLCTLLLAACGGDDAEQQAAGNGLAAGGGDAAGDSALFSRIDADTAWLIANSRPLPEDLSEMVWAPMASMADFNRETYTSLADELEDAPLAAAFLREVAAIDGREALAERGIDPNGRWAVHAVSLYPFVSWQLTDPDAFQAMLDRVAAEAEMELNWRDIEDARVMWVDFEGMGLALSYDDRFVTAAIIPDNLALMRRVANLDQPARAFNPAELSKFESDRGYTPYGSGFIEFERIVGQLLDGDDEMLAAARGSSRLSELAEDEACRAELGALVGIFPRLSLGYSELNESLMAFDMTIETDAEFANRMRGIADVPVGLDRGQHGIFDFGLAINIVGARDFAREVVGGWVENPPQCPLFEGIREDAGEWQAALNQAIPPVVTNFQGFRLSLKDFELSDEMNVESAEGTLGLFMRNPQMMLGMAQMFSPELAALDLTPGSGPQQLPEGVIPNLPAGIPAFIAVGDAALGLAVGQSQLDRMDEALTPGEGDGAILNYGFDFAAYAQLLDQLMGTIQSELEEMEDSEVLGDPTAGAKGMLAAAEYYDYSNATLHLTERGIEFRSKTRLKQ